MSEFNKERWKEWILKNPNLREIDPKTKIIDWYQTVLNIGYTEWQKEENKRWDYSDMIGWMKTNFGNIPAFFVLFGKYNQQVGNGGHLQYHYNNYDYSRGIDLHGLLTVLLSQYKYDLLENGTEAMEILKEYRKIQVAAQRYQKELSRRERHYDCSEEDDESFDREKCDELDKRYYKIDDAFMKSLQIEAEKLFKVDVPEKNQKPIETRIIFEDLDEFIQFAEKWVELNPSVRQQMKDLIYGDDTDSGLPFTFEECNFHALDDIMNFLGDFNTDAFIFQVSKNKIESYIKSISEFLDSQMSCRKCGGSTMMAKTKWDRRCSDPDCNYEFQV